MSDLVDLDLVAAAAALERGDVGAVELTEAYLAQVERTEPRVHAWTTVDADGALAQARAAQAALSRGERRGPLHGIPVGVKDLVDTAGLRTTYGSPRFERHVPSRDAAVVERLRACGAVVLGKQATHELAWGGRTDSAHFGPTRNPHDADRVPGGSSGGGAASVVVRSCLLAIGTDTAGSARIPAALSGCVGYKPSRDWLPMTGVMPLAASLDHVGLLGRTVADVSVARAALLGGRGTGTAGPPLGRVALVDDADAWDPAVAEGVERAARVLADAGLDVRRVTPEPPAAERAMAVLTRVRREAERVHRDAYAREPGGFGADVAALMDLGPVTDAEAARADAVAARAVAWVADVWRDADVLLGATVPVTAPRIGEHEVELAGRRWPVEPVLTRETSIANVLGAPSVSVPVPRDGLPVGVQLVARPGAEDVLEGVASRLG
ncbi:amidase [Aeromicrobium sp. IC_218]|uniref:amidase n=1 Tax=Aeromicrobium sp. IC_218 TaxID=2545468 RepID=UPI0013F446B0|nr:amidase [Aeromicrobium sp. IC_218]